MDFEGVAGFVEVPLGEHPVWRALGPALIVTAYFLIGLGVYTVRAFLRGRWADGELEKRGSTWLLGLWIRLFFSWLMQPLWHLVRASGIPASAITTLSVALACGSGIALATGRFALGGWLAIAGGICDFLDGRVARATGQACARGAALDSVLDRYSDAVVLCGLAWYYRHTWVLLAVLAALCGSLLVSYVRARGEGLGVRGGGEGLMQRAERVVVLGVATALTPLYDLWVASPAEVGMHWLAVGGLLLLAVGTQTTAASRLLGLLAALGRPRPPGGLPQRVWLVRSAVSSAVATGLDFALVAFLVSRHAVPPWAATGIGSLFGAGINFSLNRFWTFGAAGRIDRQAARYALVSVSSALLNAGGVALIDPVADYRLGWALTRGIVYFAWNFPLQRDYVFARAAPVGLDPPGADAALDAQARRAST